MAGTERRYSGKELRELCFQEYPGWRIITRKPTNHACLLIHEKTGYTVKKSSNYEMVEYLTDPQTKIDLGKGDLKGFDLVPYNDASTRKSDAVLNAEKALYYAEEAAECQCPYELEPSIRMVRDPKGHLILVINGVSYAKP